MIAGMCNRQYFVKQKVIYTLVVFILFAVTTKKRCYGMRHIASLFYYFMMFSEYPFLYLIVFRMAFSLPMKSSTFSLVRQRGGSRRRRLVPAQPVKQCWS